MARSGQITVAESGTAVQGDDVEGVEFYIAAHPDNTNDAWVGNDGAGDVTANNGYPLPSGGDGIPIRVSNLNELWFDVDTNGEKVCWIKYR